jgi:heme-degrading monooxygenase HmoA
VSVHLALSTVGAPLDWMSRDARLVEAVRPFLEQPGVLLGWVARRITDPRAAEHVVASIWRSAEDLRAGAALEAWLADLPASPDRGEDVLAPVAVALRWVRPTPARILRVYRGRVRPGDLDAYVAEARQGAEEDGARPDGPEALYIARLGHDAFLTVSSWSDWESLTAATGGDIRQPALTRKRERLLDGSPRHYEIMEHHRGSRA